MASNLSSIIQDGVLGTYSAVYKAQSTQANPLTCNLPDDISVSFSLPPIEPINISTDCNPPFIALPLVPRPYIPPLDIVVPCAEGYNFSAGISVRYGTQLIPNSIKLIPSSEGDTCNYKWDGELVLAPYSAMCSNLTFNGGLIFKVNGLPLPAQNNTVKLIPDGTCGAKLDGAIDLNIPEFQCPTGFSFSSEGIKVKIRNTGDASKDYLTEKENTVQLGKKATSSDPTGNCNYGINGLLDFSNLPQMQCANGMQFSGGIKIYNKDSQGNYQEIPGASTVAISHPSGDLCNIDLSGDIKLDIPQMQCPTGFSFENKAVFKANGIKQNGSIEIVTGQDACHYVLQGDIDFSFPNLCASGFSFKSSATTDSLIINNRQIGSTTNKLNFAANTDGCGAVLTGGLSFNSSTLPAMPIYLGPYVLGGEYFPGDMVTYELNGNKCTYIRNPGSTELPPGPNSPWKCLGCEKSTTSNTTVDNSSHPFAVFKISDNTVMVNQNSSLLAGLNGQQVVIYGLGKTFSISDGQAIYLDVVYSPNSGNPQPLAAAVVVGTKPASLFYAKPYAGEPIGWYPSGTVVANGSQFAAIVAKAESEISSDSALASVPRFLHSYTIIAYTVTKGAGKFDLTNFGLYEALNQNLMVAEATVQGIPGFVVTSASSGFIAIKEKVDEPVINLDITSKTFTITCETSAAQISYAILSGTTEPTDTDWKAYTDKVEISIEGKFTVWSKATKEDMNPSGVVSVYSES